MKNPRINQTAILIPDYHVYSFIRDLKELSLAQEQQKQIAATAKWFTQAGKKVHMIVEDVTSFIDRKYGYSSLYKPYGQKIDTVQGHVRYCYSPLIGLQQLCDSLEIRNTNIEFRDDEDPTFVAAIIQSIKEQARFDCTGTLNKLQNYYPPDTDAPFLGAQILNGLEKNPADISFICAGLGHIAIVSRILYTRGYRKVDVQANKELAATYKNFLCSYKDSSPFPGTLTSRPVPLDQDIRMLVIKSLRTLEA